jgi:hypothetical protein
MSYTNVPHYRERLIGILDFRVGFAHPRTDDLVPAPTRLPKWIDPIEGVLSEECGNILGVARDPGLEVGLKPISKALQIHVV